MLAGRLAGVAAWVMWEKKMWPSERARVGRPKVSLIYGAAGGERASRLPATGCAGGGVESRFSTANRMREFMRFHSPFDAVRRSPCASSGGAAAE